MWIALFLVLLAPGVIQFVRNFGGRQVKHPIPSIKTLFGPSEEGRIDETGTLDERGIQQRNVAYYQAYLIIGPLILLAVFSLLIRRFLQVLFPHIDRMMGISLYMLYLLYLRLPHQLIRWHEPDIEE
jgi:hypothetical protein